MTSGARALDLVEVQEGLGCVRYGEYSRLDLTGRGRVGDLISRAQFHETLIRLTARDEVLDSRMQAPYAPPCATSQ